MTLFASKRFPPRQQPSFPLLVHLTPSFIQFYDGRRSFLPVEMRNHVRQEIWRMERIRATFVLLPRISVFALFPAPRSYLDPAFLSTRLSLLACRFIFKNPLRIFLFENFHDYLLCNFSPLFFVLFVCLTFVSRYLSTFLNSPLCVFVFLFFLFFFFFFFFFFFRELFWLVSCDRLFSVYHF